MTSPLQLSQPVPLGDLITAIEKVHDDVLDQLSDAMLAAEALHDVGDALIGHFVDRARRSGQSWSAIGSSMGVTKQAAQKRFKDTGAPPAPLDPQQGFARFTPEARNVVVGAQNAAAGAGNDTIGAVHLVLGLVADPSSAAVQALAGLGVTAEQVRERATAALPAAAEAVPALIPFDEAARAVLERSFQEAVSRDAEDVGTRDILLALLTLGHAAPLPELGVTTEQVVAATVGPEAG
jgi:ClpA/ClpB-like protein